MPAWLRRLSIKWRLVLAAAICLVPSAYLGLHNALLHKQEHEAQVRRNLEMLVATLTLKYREDLTTAERNLRLLAATFRFLTSDPERCSRLLKYMVSLNADRYTNVMLVDREGRDVCYAAKPVRPPESDRNFLIHQLRTQSFAIGTLRRTERNAATIPLAVLAEDNDTGVRLGAVGLGMDISSLVRLAAQSGIPTETYLGFMDAKGEIHAAGPAPDALPDAAALRRSAGDRAVFLRAGQGDGAATFVVAPLDHGRLYVVAGFKDAIMYGEAGNEVIAAFALYTLIMFATLTLVLAAANHFALRPLRLLAKAVTGQDPNRRDFAYGSRDQPREIAELATAFAGYIANEHEYRSRMKNLVEQRDLLLRELNHRVKNNLQLVMNLLSLQERRCAEEPVRRQLGQARARIGTMALLHRQLYAQGETTLVEIRRYLEDLVRGLESIDSAALRLDVTAPRLRVPIDLAVPLGMFVTEAVTNAMKHAFPDRSDGRIAVTLRLHPDGGGAALEVCDDGVGMSGADDGRRTLGTLLLRGLAEQIGGTLEINSAGGTCVALSFPLPGAEQVPPHRDASGT